MKLLLGCGDEQREGWIHHDRVQHSEHVDSAWDLEYYPWPWPDGAFERIEAMDVLEHLTDTVAFMDECWRILKPGGALKVRVPHYQSEDAWRDPTHKRAFHPDTFQYFDPDKEWGELYGQFYTDKHWQLSWMGVGSNITVELEKRGDA